MRAHRGRQHLGRQRPCNRRVDRADQHDRELDEARHLVEQPGIGLDGQPLGRARRSRSARDQLAATVLVEDHIGGFELVEIIGGVVDRDLALRQEAVAARRPADRDLRPAPAAATAPSNRQMTEIERPHPAQAARRKAHRFRPGNSAIAAWSSSGSTSAAAGPAVWMIAK